MQVFFNKVIKAKPLAVSLYAVIVLTLVIFPFGQLPANQASSYKPEAQATGGGSTYCELTLTKSDTGYDPISPGEELVYYLTLENTGTADCTGGGVRLKDYYDDRTSYVRHVLGDTYPSNQDFVVNDDYMQWNFATMNPGDFREIWLTMKVDDDVACDAILINKAKYYSNQTGWSDYLEEDTSLVCDPECGDGNLDPGEQCDDGNLVNGDGCSDICELETECEEFVTIDFDQYPAGTILDDEYTSVGATFSVINNNGPDAGIVFDSANPTGDDTDLITPGYHPTNTQAQDKIMVIAEDIVDTNPADGLVDDPDDEKSGGVITVDFPEELEVFSVSFVDIEEDGGKIRTYDDSSSLNDSINITNLGDNSFQTIYVGDQNAKKMEVKLAGSGAVSEIKYCKPNTPDPECGDGNLDPGEQCDDGNLVNGDGCDNQCKLEDLCPTPIDVMLIMDRSQSMEDDTLPGGPVQPLQDSKDAAKYFIDLMDSQKDQVGLVSYATDATLDHILSTDFSSVKATIDAMNAYGWTNIGKAFDLATGELNTNSRQDAFPIMILLTDGNPNVNEQGFAPDETGGRAYATQEAEIAKNAGYVVYTIGLGTAVQSSFLETLATSPDHYFYAPTSQDLDNIYLKIANHICEYGSISGCKYDDADNSGTIDPNETTLDGFEIVLDSTVLDNPVTKTTENGCYAFTGLEPGTYTVAENVSAGWAQTYPINPDFYTVDLDWEEYLEDYDFANYFDEGPECGDGIKEGDEQCDDGNLTNGDGCSDICELEYASISGCKYNDEDGDGVLTGSEPTMSGVTIRLTYSPPPGLTGVWFDTQETDQDGCYKWDQLHPGTYHVDEIVEDPWVQTFPQTPYANIQLEYLDDLTGYDFGNYMELPPEVGSISGCKYNDANNNGVIDNGEETIAGWGITITYPDSTQVNDTTNDNGCYLFEDLPMGTYVISEENRSGWTQTYPINPDTHTVTLTAPQSIVEKDFANYEDPAPFCGDGVINQPSEECDEGVNNGVVCSPNYGQSCNYCSNSCTTITVDGPYCGDGVINGNEQCDEGVNNGGDLCSLECTLPEPFMDVELMKTVDSSSVVVGESVVFTITVENTGTIDATGVMVEDRMENGLNYISNTVSKGYYSSDYGLWTVGDLAVGEFATLALVVNVNAERAMTNVAEIIEHNEVDHDSTPGNDILSEDDQDEATVTGTTGGCTENCGGGGGGSPTKPRIVIVKSAAVAWTNPDSIVDYTISITNTGTALGRDLVLTDVLPTGLEYASSSINGTWDLGNIDKNQTKTVEYKVNFPEGLTSGNYLNTATADISNGNSASDDAVVEVRGTTVLGFKPVLAIDKVVDREFTNPGGEAIYTVTVTNTNNEAIALNVNMVDRLPASFTFAEDGTTVKSWLLGDLGPGQSKTTTFKVNISSGTANGFYDNLATAYSDNAPEVSDIEPLEVRQVIVEGFVLPDTNGSVNFFLSIFAGFLMILLSFMLWKYRQLDSIRI